MEFTRAAHVVVGILIHSSIMTPRSCWMLDTVLLLLLLEDAPWVLNRVRSADILHTPWPLHHLHLQLPQQGSCHLAGVFGVVIMPFGPVSEGRASCSASECCSTCWNPCFPQWRAAVQFQQSSCRPRLPPHATTTILDCWQDTMFLVLLTGACTVTQFQVLPIFL